MEGKFFNKELNRQYSNIVYEISKISGLSKNSVERSIAYLKNKEILENKEYKLNRNKVRGLFFNKEKFKEYIQKDNFFEIIDYLFIIII